MSGFDVAVIGGGSAGYAAARTATAAGAKVALIEGGEVGGLCILKGCMPTKTLLESAHRFHEIVKAHEFGIKVAKPTAQWSKIIERKNKLVEEFASYRRHQLVKGKFDFIKARASFLDAHSLGISTHSKSEVETPPQKLLARSYIIATGSVIDRMSIPGLEETGYLTSDDALDLKRPPKSLIILGGGAIAVEFAQYFLRLGVRVTLIQRNKQLIKSYDADVAGVLEKVFTSEGMRVYTHTELLEVKRLGKNKSVVFEQEGKKTTVVAEEILYALGRRPAIEGLGLENAGVKFKGKILGVNAKMQTSQPHIFAVGDVAGPYEVVHSAILQGELAARNALKVIHHQSNLEEMDYRLHLEIIFTDPEIAAVGLNEKEAKAKKIPYRMASYPFADHGKSMVMGALEGFVKILSNPDSGEIIGAQIAGPRAADLIHELVVAMHFRSTVQEFLKIPHYHPTLAEIITYPIEELAEAHN